MNRQHLAVTRLKDQGLTGDDLVRTFISRRISPLQERSHKIYDMSGRYDPSRHSTAGLTKEQIWKRVKAISKTKSTLDWVWGVEPYSRAHPPLVVSYSLSDILFYVGFAYTSGTLFSCRHIILC